MVVPSTGVGVAAPRSVESEVWHEDSRDRSVLQRGDPVRDDPGSERILRRSRQDHERHRRGCRGAEFGVFRIFRGIPFAAPPVSELRWKAPQPVATWEGVRPAAQFGPRCMQLPIFGDMDFRANGTSEDCLYLNVWTPAKSRRERLPVLVYFYGGGFPAATAPSRATTARAWRAKGIVASPSTTGSGIFGFFSHPELTQESPHQASGNYGLLDQNAALSLGAAEHRGLRRRPPAGHDRG